MQNNCFYLNHYILTYINAFIYTTCDPKYTHHITVKNNLLKSNELCTPLVIYMYFKHRKKFKVITLSIVRFTFFLLI